MDLTQQISNSAHFNEDNLFEVIDETIYPPALNGSITASGKFSMSKMKLHSDEDGDNTGKYLRVKNEEGEIEFADVEGEGGELPAGTDGQTLRNNNGSWEATDLIQVDYKKFGSTEFSDIILGKDENYGNLLIKLLGLQFFKSEGGAGAFNILADAKFEFLNGILKLQRFFEKKYPEYSEDDELSINISELQKFFIKEKNEDYQNVDNTGKYLRVKNEEGEIEFADVNVEAETSLEDIEGEPSNTLTFNKNGKLEETDRIRVYNNDEYEEQTLEIVSTSEYTDGDGRNCYNGSNIEQYAIDSNANVSIRAAINGYNNQWGSAGIFVEADIDADTDTIETYIDLQAKHIAIDNGEDNAGKYLKVNQDQEIEFVNVEAGAPEPKPEWKPLRPVNLPYVDGDNNIIRSILFDIDGNTIGLLWTDDVNVYINYYDMLDDEWSELDIIYEGRNLYYDVNVKYGNDLFMLGANGNYKYNLQTKQLNTFLNGTAITGFCNEIINGKMYCAVFGTNTVSIYSYDLTTEDFDLLATADIIDSDWWDYSEEILPFCIFKIDNNLFFKIDFSDTNKYYYKFDLVEENIEIVSSNDILPGSNVTNGYAYWSNEIKRIEYIEEYKSLFFHLSPSNISTPMRSMLYKNNNIYGISEAPIHFVSLDHSLTKHGFYVIENID